MFNSTYNSYLLPKLLILSYIRNFQHSHSRFGNHGENEEVEEGLAYKYYLQMNDNL